MFLTVELKALYSKVFLTLSTFRNLHKNHYLSLEIVVIQLLELKTVPLEDRSCVYFRDCRWSQQQAFPTCVFHMNRVGLCGQIHLSYSFLGSHTPLRIILIPFRRGKKTHQNTKVLLIGWSHAYSNCTFIHLASLIAYVIMWGYL